MSLVFYPKSHRYRLDGEWVPGVTTLIGKGLPKPALVGAAARVAAEFAADHRDALWSLGRDAMVAAVREAQRSQWKGAGVKGTDIHDFAERIMRGEEVEVPETIVGYVEAALRFMEDWQIEPLAIECPLASRTYLYAGKLDLAARSFGRVAIFDWKTGASGIWGETALQLNAYANSEFYLDGETERPTAELGIEAAYGVHLRPDGYDVYPLEFGPHVFEDFLTVAASAAVAGRVPSYVLDPVEPPTQIAEVA